MKRLLLCVAAISVLCVGSVFAQEKTENPGYAIVVSSKTLVDENWSKVVQALQAKYQNTYAVSVVKWDDDLTSVQDSLIKMQPKYICFVAKWKEATKQFVQTAHVLTRLLDDDPYTDAIWAVMTGYDYTDPLRMIAAEDMTVESIAAGTPVSLKYFDSGIWFDESAKNHYEIKESGEKAVEHRDGPDDTTQAIAEAIGETQLFITSGHATENDWQIGYSYKNGYFSAKAGQLYGNPTDGDKFPITLKNSKIHLASGNCLIGHIKDKNSMALALLHSGGFNTMIGYMEPTWFGYMGWGIQDYYIEQPGRFTIAEAFFANNQAITYHLERLLPGYSNDCSENKVDKISKKFATLSRSDKEFVRGLMFDQNMVAIYGDPAWQTALKAQDSGWKQELKSKQLEDGTTQWTFTVTPLKGENSFGLVTANGSQRGGRPIFQFLPQKIGDTEIIQGDSLNAIITDDFILLPASEGLKNDQPTVLKFIEK